MFYYLAVTFSVQSFKRVLLILNIYPFSENYIPLHRNYWYSFYFFKRNHESNWIYVSLNAFADT